MKRTMKTLSTYLVCGAVAVLTGCGGGGGGGTPAPVISTLSFPIQTGYKNYIKSSQTLPFKISGVESGISYSGSGYITDGQLTNSTYEGVFAYSKTTAGTGSIAVNGQTVPWSNTITNYFDSNYNPVGSVSSEYQVVTSFTAMPSLMKVGDTGTWYQFDRYSSTTKNAFTKLGSGTVTYVVLPDTERSALVKITEVRRDAFYVRDTAISTYRVDAIGALTKITEEVTDNTSTLLVTY